MNTTSILIKRSFGNSYANDALFFEAVYDATLKISSCIAKLAKFPLLSAVRSVHIF